ncbi:hypothetical protein GCM10023321_47010 [Pseudonocardia eucalypti]|uniref:Tyr recombinase domain-containing protein n=1 Tax=Pseudonocardia eucalypti TaxID=648755 RepID=A0ABP9QHL6_9PSEU
MRNRDKQYLRTQRDHHGIAPQVLVAVKPDLAARSLAISDESAATPVQSNRRQIALLAKWNSRCFAVWRRRGFPGRVGRSFCVARGRGAGEPGLPDPGVCEAGAFGGFAADPVARSASRAASLSLAAANELKTVQALLDHSSIAVTADTYTSVLRPRSGSGDRCRHGGTRTSP